MSGRWRLRACFEGAKKGLDVAHVEEGVARVLLLHTQLSFRFQRSNPGGPVNKMFSWTRIETKLKVESTEQTGIGKDTSLSSEQVTADNTVLIFKTNHLGG